MNVRGQLANQTSPGSRTLFLSYRRDDSHGVAGRLYDRLSAHYGEKDVFFDVDSIDPGLDFRTVIQHSVTQASVLLALIGSRWLTASDEHGRRRLDKPNDLVALEIALALDRDIPVIPVLLDGAHMPRADELPPVLQRLARRNAAPVAHASFRRDVTSLLSSLDRLMDLPSRSAAASGSPPQPLRPIAPQPAIDWRGQQELVALVRNQTFPPGRITGYDPSSVDLFRDQVESETERRIDVIVALNAGYDADLRRMPVGQVLSWRFATVRHGGGYDRDEVDKFVETVREGFSRLEATIEQLLTSRS